MSSHETISSNITQILNTVDYFIDLYESDVWLKNVSTEEVKNAFKSGAFIEKSMENFQKQNCLDKFITALNSWWITKDRFKFYKSHFYIVACDHMLAKFFKSKILKSSSVDIAVRIYTAMFPRERFEKMLSQLLSKTFSYNAILEFTVYNKADIALQELECSLLLKKWAEESDRGRLENVKMTVEQMLANYRINSTLPILFNLLNLEDVSRSELHIKNLILDQIKQKMLDRSAMSKSFWLTVFNDVDKRVLVEICCRYRVVLECLLNFVVYLGCMMNLELVDGENKWVGDANSSICPEISYGSLIGFVKCLNSCEKLQGNVKMKVREAKMTTKSKLWDDILLEID